MIQLFKKSNSLILMPILAIFCIFLFSCTVNSQKNKGSSSRIPTVDNPGVGGFGPDVTEPNFNPPEESCDLSNPVEVKAVVDGQVIDLSNFATLDFGLNQTGEVKCFNISYTPKCARANVEIVEASAKTILPGNDGADNQTSDEFIASVLGDPGEMNVCYQRLFNGDNPNHIALNPGNPEERIHIGQLNIVINDSFATVVNLRGRTIRPVIDLREPVNNLLVWQGSNHEYIDHSEPGTPAYDTYIDRPYFKHYKVPVAGIINPNGRHLLTSGQVALAVKRGGITSFAPINAENGSFGNDGLSVEMPVGPAFSNQLFTVEASVNTIHGKIAIQRTLIPYAAPDFELEVRNQGDVAIGKENPQAIAYPTNSKRIVTGVKIKNAHLSAPNSNYPACARLRLRKGDNNFQVVDKFTDGYGGVLGCGNPGFVPLYLEDYSFASDGECVGGFVDGLTPYQIAYCDIFDEIKSDFSNGVNTLETTICTDYTARMPNAINGCLVKTTSIVVNTSKPTIRITQIGDERVFDDSLADQPNVIVTPQGNQIIIEGLIDQTQIQSEEGECQLELRVNNSLASGLPSINLCEGNYLEIIRSEGNPLEGQREDYQRLSFSIPLSFNSPTNHLIKGKNLLRFTATNSLGHTTIKVFSFDVGNEKGISNSRVNRRVDGNLVQQNDLSVKLGEKVIDRNGSKVENAPLSFKISKETFADQNLKKLITKFMNENVKMSDLVTGGGLKINDEGRYIPLGPIRTNTDYARMKKGSMPEMLRALRHYQGNDYDLLFRENEILDPAGNIMTHAVIAPYIYQYLNDNFIDDWISDLPRGAAIPPSWPGFCGRDPNCSSFPIIEGKWSVNDLEIDNNGFINMTLELTGRSGDDNSYLEESGLNRVLNNRYDRLPAFMGVYVAHGMVRGGVLPILTRERLIRLTGIDFIDEEIARLFGEEGNLPVILNLDTVTIRLNDVLRVLDASFTYNADGDEVLDTSCGNEVCECRSDSRVCKPYIHVYKDRVRNDGDLVEFVPYDECQGLIMDILEGVSIDDNGTPFEFRNGQYMPHGCRNNQENIETPILLEVTSSAGTRWFNDLFIDGLRDSDKTILDAMEAVFVRTVKNKIMSLPHQIHLPEQHQLAMNAYLDSSYNYPNWFPIADQIEELSFAITHNEDKDDIELKLRENVENGDQVLLFAEPHLEDMELSFEEDDIGFKLPISFGSEDTPLINQGFLYQSFADDFSYNRDYPLAVDAALPSLSTSFDFANFMNAFSKVAYNQNLHTILGDILGLKLYGQDPDNIGPTELVVDIVTLGRLGICDSLLEILNPRLSAGALFANMSNYFPYDNTQLKITLDPDHPATFTLMEPDEVLYGESEDENGQFIQGTDATLVIGLSNIRMDAYNLEESIIDDEIRFQGRDRVLSVRMDMLIKIDLKFEGNEVYAYIHPNKSQVIYNSVIDGAGSFHDPEVIESLWEQVIKVVMPQLSTEGVDTPSFIMRFPEKLSKIGDIRYIPADEVYIPLPNNQVEGVVLENRLTNLASNGECISGQEPLYIGEVRPAPDPILENEGDEDEEDNPHGEFKDPEILRRALTIEELVHNCKVRSYNEEQSFKEDFFCDFGIGEITTYDTEVELDTNYGGFHFKTNFELDLILGLEDLLE
jgi:hypothetical protein